MQFSTRNENRNSNDRMTYFSKGIEIANSNKIKKQPQLVWTLKKNLEISQ